jgi:hypothetical protein
VTVMSQSRNERLFSSLRCVTVAYTYFYGNVGIPIIIDLLLFYSNHYETTYPLETYIGLYIPDFVQCVVFHVDN